MNKFSQQLVTLRQAAGISQEQLATQLHVSRQAVSKWENGTAVPDLDKIIQIAAILQVSLDELVLGKEPQISQSDLAKLLANSQGENHRHHREIHNGWEFLARYWWIIFAFIGFLYGIFSGLYGIIHN